MPILVPFQISKIENLSHLAELRVLNLAGNELSVVNNLSGLDSLTELNLRRNRIASVVSFVFVAYFVFMFTLFFRPNGYEGDN